MALQLAAGGPLAGGPAAAAAALQMCPGVLAGLRGSAYR